MSADAHAVGVQSDPVCDAARRLLEVVDGLNAEGHPDTAADVRLVAEAVLAAKASPVREEPIVAVHPSGCRCESCLEYERAAEECAWAAHNQQIDGTSLVGNAIAALNDDSYPLSEFGSVLELAQDVVRAYELAYADPAMHAAQWKSPELFLARDVVALHAEVVRLRHTLGAAASACGNPDAAEGCRQVIRLAKEALG